MRRWPYVLDGVSWHLRTRHDTSLGPASKGREGCGIVDIDRIAAPLTTATFAPATIGPATVAAGATGTGTGTAPTSTTAEVASTLATASSTAPATRRFRGALFDLEIRTLLPLPLALGLWSGSGDEGILLLVARQRFRLGPLLVRLGVFVGSSGLGSAQVQALGRLLGQVVGVRFGVVFRFGLARRFGLLVLSARMLAVSVGGFDRGRIEDGLLLVGFGDGLASLFVLPLSVAARAAPALGYFLFRVRSTGPVGMAIIGSATTSASTTTAATVLGRPVLMTTLCTPGMTISAKAIILRLEPIRACALLP